MSTKHGAQAISIEKVCVLDVALNVLSGAITFIVDAAQALCNQKKRLMRRYARAMSPMRRINWGLAAIVTLSVGFWLYIFVLILAGKI